MGCGSVTMTMLSSGRAGIFRMRSRPSAKRIDDIAAEQHRKMIAFGEDRQIDAGAKASDDIRHRIGVAVERRNIAARNHRRPPDEGTGRLFAARPRHRTDPGATGPKPASIGIAAAELAMNARRLHQRADPRGVPGRTVGRRRDRVWRRYPGVPLGPGLLATCLVLPGSPCEDSKYDNDGSNDRSERSAADRARPILTIRHVQAPIKPVEQTQASARWFPAAAPLRGWHDQVPPNPAHGRPGTQASAISTCGASRKRRERRRQCRLTVKNLFLEGSDRRALVRPRDPIILGNLPADRLPVDRRVLGRATGRSRRRGRVDQFFPSPSWSSHWGRGSASPAATAVGAIYGRRTAGTWSITSRPRPC